MLFLNISLKLIWYICPVIPAGSLQLCSQGEGAQGIQSITMTNASSGGTIVQYAGQDGQFFVPGEIGKFYNILTKMKNEF